MREQSLFPDLPQDPSPPRQVRPGKYQRVLEMLMAQGKTERAARTIIGGWIKQAGGDSDAVLDMVDAAEKVEAVDLTAYVYACIKSRASKRSHHAAAAEAVENLLSRR